MTDNHPPVDGSDSTDTDDEYTDSRPGNDSRQPCLETVDVTAELSRRDSMVGEISPTPIRESYLDRRGEQHFTAGGCLSAGANPRIATDEGQSGDRDPGDLDFVRTSGTMFSPIHRHPESSIVGCLATGEVGRDD